MLKSSTTKLIRRENPYRKAEEIAKVMDLSPGTLNITGFAKLRKGLEIKNKNGKIPNGKGWLCGEWFVKHAMYAIEQGTNKVIPYSMLPPNEINGFEVNDEHKPSTTIMTPFSSFPML